MRINLYSLRDSVTGLYGAPSVALSDAVATRDFAELICGDSHYNRIAKDIDLMYVGSFDNESGEISVANRVFVANGLDVKESN